MATQAQHKAWLKVAAGVVGVGAPVLFLGTMTATAEPARFVMDLLAWPLDGATTWASHDVRFLSALSGGFLLGWAMMIWGLATKLHDVAPEAVRQVFLTSALAWFVLDSAGSIASGTASNALFNVPFLLTVVGPMWRPAKG